MQALGLDVLAGTTLLSTYVPAFAMPTCPGKAASKPA